MPPAARAGTLVRASRLPASANGGRAVPLSPGWYTLDVTTRKPTHAVNADEPAPSSVVGLVAANEKEQG